jgi:hypothetical protein
VLDVPPSFFFDNIELAKGAATSGSTEERAKRLRLADGVEEGAAALSPGSEQAGR